MLIPIILSGGAGTRLWPVSREAHPKQFIRLSDGQSLLQKTFVRASTLPQIAEVMIVTNCDYYFQTRDDISELKYSGNTHYLLEPSGQNTAPAILLAALDVAARHGEDAIILVLPADHLIQNSLSFANDVTLAVSEARRGQIATFGVPPTRPETGFGYISIGAATGSGAWHVSGFHEKPNLELAQEFYNSKRFYWNAGMFCMRVNDVLSAFSECVPDLYSTGKSCFTSSNANKQIPNVLELELAAFSKCENISFDYAVMEKFDRVSVVPASFDWTDIGSWNALSELVPLDENGNRTSGDVIAIDVKNSYLQSDQRLIAAIGIEDLIVVDTPDALLISHQSKTQEVKQVVKQLKASGHEVATLHRTVTRPWGTYTVLESGDRYKIKRIEVRPGASLSLQMHHHRNEHWIVVSGTAKVVNGEREFLVLTNESTYIPAGHKHRLENPGVMPLVMIEVQSGEYLGEDDIVRFQDAYGRV